MKLTDSISRIPHPLALPTLLCPLLGACGGGGDELVLTADFTAPTFTSTPVWLPSPNPEVPNAAQVTVEADEPSRVRLEFDDGVRTWSVLASKQLAMRHEVPVIGMRAGLTHEIDVVLIDAAGNEKRWAGGPLVFDSPMLPDLLSAFSTTVSDPARMEPGATLLVMNIVAGGGPQPHVLMLDEAGEIVWWFHSERWTPNHVEELRNGNLLVLDRDRLMGVEIDRLGNQVDAWRATRWTGQVHLGTTAVHVDTLHHELTQLPEGADADFLALSTELRDLADYPTDEVDPTVVEPSASVIGDTIVEFLRDGTVVREHSLFDALDPYRMCYDTLGGFWNPTYGIPTRDWTHANAVTIDPADGNYVVSVRHQDCLVKIDRQSGALIWILGDPARWELPWSDFLLDPVGTPFEWPSHQHAPEYDAQGNLVMFDNGNHRAIPPAPSASLNPDDRYSRVVVYAIDEQAGTVEQVWSYGEPGEWLSLFLGDADPLPLTGNVLVTDGAQPQPGGPATGARVFEVTRSDPPEIVFEVGARDPTHATRFTVYRAERISGVYPE